jgi:predicted RNA-binding protein Jag
MSNKKFFSGNSLRQALISAAAHFDVPADEIAYREVEKKHGFLKVRKRAVIEVDADDPRRAPGKPEAKPAAEVTGRRVERGEAVAAGAADLPADPSHGRPPRLPRETGTQWGGAGDRTGPARGHRPSESDDEEAAAAGAETPAEETAAAPDSRRRRARTPRIAVEEPVEEPVEKSVEKSEELVEEPEDEDDDWEEEDQGGDEQEDADDDDEDDDEDDEDDDEDEDLDDDDHDRTEAARPAPRTRAAAPTTAPGGVAGEEAAREGGRGRRRRRRGGRGRGAASATERTPSATRAADDDDLVALPERPRRPSERYAEARGPLADATREAVDRVLDVAGLDLTYTVLQGDDERLEIDLSGLDEALLVAEGGELLRAIEHLVPRVVRGIAGEPVQVRVDSSDFHEIHEEQLRSLAQRVASEVRRGERPRTLEPMSPADRRIVHITLADEPRVTSMSEGSGYFKRIVVKPA